MLVPLFVGVILGFDISKQSDDHGRYVTLRTYSFVPLYLLFSYSSFCSKSSKNHVESQDEECSSS